MVLHVKARLQRFLFAMLLVSSSTVAVAEVFVKALGNDLFVSTVAGVIEEDDCKNFRSGIVSRGQFPVLVEVSSSPGGDVGAAMCMGELIRAGALTTTLDGHCDSACFLVWAAGVSRIAHEGSTFGLHRPRFDHQYFAALPHDEANQRYGLLDASVRAYLRRMNIPTSISDRMMMTKSSSIERIDATELVSGVGDTAPAHEEWVLARCGELSSAEQADYLAMTIGSLNKRGIKEFGDDSVRYAELSEAYKEQLRQKSRDLYVCRTEATKELQQTVLNTLR